MKVMGNYLKKAISLATILIVGALALINFDRRGGAKHVTWKDYSGEANFENISSEAFSKKGHKDQKRSMASTVANGPQFVIRNGERKLLIRLHFYCSAWLYTRFAVNPPETPESINFRECEIEAKASTAVANLIFTNSKIPVEFQYEFSVEPTLSTRFEGRYESLEQIRNKVRTTYSAASDMIARANSNDNHTNPTIMPVFQFRSFESALKYVPAVGGEVEEYVDQASKINIPTGSFGVVKDDSIPEFKYDTVTCKNPNSTQRLTTFQVVWGVNKNDFLKVKVRKGDKLVGYCFQGCGNTIANHIEFNSFKGLLCLPSCLCLHSEAFSSTTSFSWTINGCRSASDPNQNLFHGINAMNMKWPGDPDLLTNWNECGFEIKTRVKVQPTPEYWISTEDTKNAIRYLVESQHPVRTILEWGVKNRASLSEMPVYNEYKVFIAVRPKSNSDVAGIALAIPDPLAKKVYLSSPLYPSNMMTLPEPLAYFRDFGIISIDSGEGTSYRLLAHELGHLLGAHHARNEVGHCSDLGDYCLKNKLGAFNNSAGYGTIMSTSYPWLNYFSTRMFKSDSNLSLGAQEDNRAQIIRMINYLSFRKLKLASIEEVSAVTTIVSQILETDEVSTASTETAASAGSKEVSK